MNAPLKPSLYSIEQDFQALEQLLDEQQGEATIQDAEAIAAFLEQLHGDLSSKLTRCLAWARNELALSEAAAAEAKRLADIVKRRQSRVDSMKAAIRRIFEAQGLRKVETPLGPVKIVANGGKAPVLVDESVDPKTLPPDLVRVTYDVNKDAVRERLEGGEQLDGFKIGERGSRVQLG